MTMIQVLNIVGLILTLAGVIVLFRYGMPYKVRTDGTEGIITDRIDQAELELEKQYDRYGRGGLVLIFLGTGLQIAANLV